MLPSIPNTSKVIFQKGKYKQVYNSDEKRIKLSSPSSSLYAQPPTTPERKRKLTKTN